MNIISQLIRQSIRGFEEFHLLISHDCRAVPSGKSTRKFACKTPMTWKETVHARWEIGLHFRLRFF